MFSYKESFYANKVFPIIVGLILFGSLIKEGFANYQNAWRAGENQRRAGKYVEARKNYEQALKLAVSGVDKAKAQIGVAQTYDEQTNY
ncbi:hypothetical protein M0P98_00785 [bacterium]|nr:hypothetical protein [bacterium]